AFGPHENMARSARRKLGEGISGWVAQNAEPLMLRGRVEDPRFSGVDPTIEESLVVPLRFGSRVVGVVATRANRKPDAHGAERLRDLDLVAGELAILIARSEEAAARMEITARLESDRREAVAMYDLARLAGIGADPQGDLDGAARLIGEAFGHERVAIWTSDLERGKLALRAAHGYGHVLPGDLVIGRSDVIDGVLAEQRPQCLTEPLPSALQSLRASSLILAPIVVARESVGMVALGRVGRPHAKFDFILASAIADTLSSLVRRELAEYLVVRAAEERRDVIARMQAEFADEMARVVYVLDACQRLLGQDRDLPTDLARAARDARSALDRLGIPLGPSAGRDLLLVDPARVSVALSEGARSATNRSGSAVVTSDPV
ncbi:MAG: GAF domain-containing protein, partial [Chloroflexota bacterium]|nr:GAF domain-containing protein [Chloroflexota bacterium]